MFPGLCGGAYSPPPPPPPVDVMGPNTEFVPLPPLLVPWMMVLVRYLHLYHHHQQREDPGEVDTGSEDPVTMSTDISSKSTSATATST